MMIVVMCLVSSAYGQQPRCKKWFKGELLGAAAIGAAAGALTGWAASSKGKHHSRSCCGEQQACQPQLGTLTTHFSAILQNNSDIPLFFTLFVSNPLCTIFEAPVIKIKPFETLPVSVEVPVVNPIEGTYNLGIQLSTQTSQTFDTNLFQFNNTVVLFVEWKPQNGKSVINDVTVSQLMPSEQFAAQIQTDIPFTFGSTIGN